MNLWRLGSPILATTACGLVIACSRGADDPSGGPAITPLGTQTPEQAIAEAEEAYRLEGVLTGDIIESEARLTTLREADQELANWGATLASLVEYPPPETPVWLVRILGYAKEPRPPGLGEPPEQCTEMMGVVTTDPFEDFNLFGKPSDKC